MTAGIGEAVAEKRVLHKVLEERREMGEHHVGDLRDGD
jgi:hypothetical protein